MGKIGIHQSKKTLEITVQKTCGAMLLCLIAAGCSTTPRYNESLTRYDPSYGYRFKNLKAGENSDSLFVILTFSGGGTRASALSLGVLEKLAETEIEWEGRRCRLLDEVDLISSVSGGSFTAAYYGAFGDEVFENFTTGLYKKNQSALIRAAFALPNMLKQASPYYSRTDTAANRYNEDFFGGLEFGDLLRKGERPYILINATDMGMRTQFSFTQDFFDLLYSDLSTYPLGYAVTASSAFPGAFAALLLKNYEQGPDFALDPSLSRWLDSKEIGTVQYNLAQERASYLDPEKLFVHLIDGGVSDNLGLFPILQNLANPDHPMGLVPTIPGEGEQKIVLIVVNAQAKTEDKVSYKGKPPALFSLLVTAGTTPMDWFTVAQRGYLNLLIQFAEDASMGNPEVEPHPATNAARIQRSEASRRFYYTEVGFDQITDDEERRFFERIPTTFTLPPESIDRLRDVGHTVLERDSVFQSLVDEIGAP
jgi:NTE family protein